MTAVAAVFALPELHEAILHQTDITTLLVSAQRVNKTWHALITASPTLQQKLFFRPILGDAHPTGAATDHNGGVEGQVILATPPPSLRRNPLLVKFFSPCFFEKRRKAYFRQANSFIAMPWTPQPRKEKLDKKGVLRSMKLDPPEDAYIQPFRERFFRKGASWRRMLVTQPPPRQLGCLWSDETVVGPYPAGQSCVAAIRGNCIALDSDSSPLRMGRLYDLVQERVCHHESQRLWFRVHWNTMQEPAYCETSQALEEQLIGRSRIVVEFVTQEYPFDIPKEPEHPDVLDDVFRCDEHERFDADFTSEDETRRASWPKRHIRGMLSKFAAVYDPE